MNYHQFLGELGRIITHFKELLVEFLPNFVGAFGIFLVGLLVARLLRALTYRLLKNIGRFIPSKAIQGRLTIGRLEPSAKVFSKFLYWVVILFFMTAATETLGLPVVTAWLSGIASYLPKIMVALLIGASGVIGGILLRDIVVAAAASSGITYGSTLGKLTQYGILLVTLLIAIEQAGIRVTFLTNLILILSAAIVFGTALSFGLGAKTSISNILASYYVQKVYKVGHTVKIGNFEGEIIRITPTAIILKSSDGQIYIPAKVFNETTSVLLRKDS